MNSLIVLADLALTGWIGLLVKLGIAAIVLWAIWAILQHFGVAIHPVVRIVLIAIISIVALVFLVQLLAALL